ncbi:MAG: hypothetical protein V3R73_07630 [Sphingomonadales bacterium]
MTKVLVATVLLGVLGLVGGSVGLASLEEPAVHNCASNTTPAPAPQRPSVVPRRV